MKLTMRASTLGRKITLIATAFILVVSSMTMAVPLLLNQRAKAAPLVTNTTANGFNAYTWKTDRTEPFAYSKVQDKLTFTVDTTTTHAINSSTFYKWEGFESNPAVTPFPTNTTSVKASLYIDPAWKTRPASASMWALATSDGTNTAWPMLGFANSFNQSYVYEPDAPNSFVGFRVYNTFTGLWTNVLPVGNLWGTTVDLEISSNPNTGNFEFYVNNLKVAEYPHNGYDSLKGVIFNNLNVKDNIAANKYYVKWTNLQTGRVTPDSGAVKNVRLVRDNDTPVANESKVNFTDVKLYWDTVVEAARYRVTVTHPDGTTTNFQPSTSATWNPTSMYFSLSDAIRHGLFGVDTGDKGQGKYQYTVAVQLGGVWSLETSPVEVTLDTGKATTEITSPGSGAILKEGTLNVKFTDTYGLKSAVTHLYTSTGQKVGTIWETFDATGETEVSRSFNLGNLPNGDYYVKANATDEAGNGVGNTATVSFTIDTLPPSATFTHSNNNDNTLVNTDVTSTLYASESIQTPAGWTKVNDTTFTKVSAQNNKGNMTITDIAGNSKSVFFEVKRIDKKDPEFNIANDKLFNVRSVNVTATEDNISVFKVDDSITPYSGTKPNYTVSVSGEGLHTVEVIDKAGNTKSVSFTIDTVGPIIIVSGNPYTTSGNVITPTFTINEPSTYNWTQVSGPTDSVVVSDTGELNPTFTVNSYGIYEYELTATDVAQNTTKKTLIFEYSPPRIIVQPTDPITNLPANGPQSTPSTPNLLTTTPTIVGPGFTNVAVLGDTTTNTGTTANNDNGEVEGASTLETAAQAVNSEANKGTFMGLAWYWWILIIAAVTGIAWWIISATRKRQAEQKFLSQHPKSPYKRKDFLLYCNYTVKTKQKQVKKPIQARSKTARPVTVRAKVSRHAKRVFVPHKENGYRPHLIRAHGLIAVLIIAVLAQVVYSVTTVGNLQVLGRTSNIETVELLADTNKEREAQGLGDLIINDQLSQAAFLKAQDMLANNYWAHTSPSGVAPWKWFGDVGYNYSTAGENLAKNYPTATATVQAWMNSPTHRENILNDSYVDVGFAVVDGTIDGRATTLVVAMYGAPVTFSAVQGEALPVSFAAPAQQGSNPLEFFGSALQSLSPVTIMILALLAVVAIVGVVAHHYRNKLPKAWKKSWRVHHGMYTFVGTLVLGVLIIVASGGGQV